MNDADRARPLGAASLLALGVNGIVGVGIFFAPSEVAATAGGYRGTFVFLATALALAPIAWTYAALGGRFHVDGGPFVWAREAFGVTFAFFVGWIAYVTVLFSVAAVITGLATHAAPVLGIAEGFSQRLFAIACLLGLTTVAATGLRPSAIVWSVLTVLKLLPLIALALLGVIADASATHGESAARDTNFARAALIVLFTTQGFEAVSVVAGSVRKPERSVPLATLGSLAVAAFLYAVLYSVCVYAVPNLADSRAPLVDAAGALGGQGAAAFVAAGANISATGIAFAMVVTAPRYLSVLGDPVALGPWISREDTRRVPQRALWLTTLAVVLLVALGDLGQLFVLSSVASIGQYAVCVASLAVLARRQQHGLSTRHIWPLPLAVIAMALALQGAEWAELWTCAGALSIGAVLLFARRPFLQRG